ncbi:fibrobacter succinogenes major paralogous domain-containing protein [Elizabethkingia anophelis]|uniref:fibrobacter succinogenes major paralogous domain-containing protein n=1 Tax=Elizabethkingia anophelis TaxID=1117645 RepID=UPI0021A70BB2|nr:hypothetical protein [Elizabethkingia anophelis]
MENRLLRTIGVGIVFLCASSCRSREVDDSINSGSQAMVSINLLGSDYANASDEGQALVSGTSYVSSVGVVDRQSVLLTPSSVIVSELSNDSKLEKSASLEGGGMASVPDASLGSGVRFRVLVYLQSTGAYQGYQDYTIGQAGSPIMLSTGVSYDIVVYSYGSTSALAGISSSEQANFSSASINYNNTNRDLMYQHLVYTPTSSTGNSLNITLRHKVARITTVVNAIGVGNLTSVSSGNLTPHYSNGVLSFSSGSISGRTSSTSGSSLTFTSSGSTTQSAGAVFLNADTAGALLGGFSANMTIAGTTKAVSMPNRFKVTPATKSTLNIKMVKCGAYIGSNGSPENFREFMCHNIGATTSADPFTPSQVIHGDKFQWGAQIGDSGSYYTQTEDQANSGALAGWNPSGMPADSWLDATKTSKDPCPTGYRVPTSSQWQAVINNNTVERVGTWSQGSYTSALYFKNPSNVRTLMLPTTGLRVYNTNGTLNNRGVLGFYWTSTESSPNAWMMTFSNTLAFTSTSFRPNGMSVRCISEN